MSESLTRIIKIESIRADKAGNGFSATLSTEYPVARGYGNEILIHSASAIDLERAPLPLVISHNTEDLNIGVVDNLKIVGRKLKGFIRLGKSKRAGEILEDIKDGILTNLSIGYQIFESHFEGDDLIATSWGPYEASLVSVGSDPNAGIGRSINSEKIKMSDKKKPEPGLSRSQKAANRDATEAERERISSIRGISSRRGYAKEAQQFIDSGKSLDAFRNFILDSMDIDNVIPAAPYDHVGVHVGFSGNDRGGDPDFSIQRVMQALVDPRSNAAEYELGVSDQLKRTLSKKGNSILVPIGRQQRSMNTATVGAGGAVVPANLASAHMIDALVAQTAIMNMPGLTTFHETDGDLIIPKVVSNPTIGTSNLDDVDTILEGDAVLDEITMSPTSITGLTKLSHKLITQASPDAEQLIRKILAVEAGSKLDFLAIQGDGVGSNPTGIVNVTGIGADTYPLAGAPSWLDIVTMEGNLNVSNAAMQSVAYLVGPVLATTLKTTEKATGTAKFVMEDGMMNGYPVRVSTNVPANTIILGDWSEAIVATWGVMELAVDPYGTNFAKGNVSVRLILDFDVSVRHAQAFTKLTEALV